jgi:hypothetical protein
MTGGTGWIRKWLVALAFVACAFAVPAVALAAMISVKGTSGDDLLLFQPRGFEKARVMLNGETVASPASGDTVDATTGAGNDTMIFDEVEDFELNLRLTTRLGRGDDLALIVGDSDPAAPDVTGTGLHLDLGSGNDQFGLHNYGDTDQIRVDAGPGDDVGRHGIYDNDIDENPDGVTVNLGSGSDRFSSVDPAVTRIDGGAGDDILIERGRGPDTLIGGEGDDTFRTRDGEADVVRCGRGNDTVRADRSDSVSSSCERVRRS